MSTFTKMLERAKQYVAKSPHDAALAVYMLRDFEETKAAELDDFAWAVSDADYCAASEATWFLSKLEKAARENADGDRTAVRAGDCAAWEEER